ncbi:MAG: DUF952 domain-containing protein [Pseudomonadota bacterium]
MSDHPDKIYKVLSKNEWKRALSQGVFKGAAVDLEDGYIHFSTAEQVQVTVAKHFKGKTDLLLVTVETKHLNDDLKWEVSRGGDLFPHLYSDLDVLMATDVVPLKDNDDGSHTFPEEF